MKEFEFKNISQLPSKTWNFIKSIKVIQVLICVIFFFAWSDIILNKGNWIPDYLLIPAGLIIPVVLLVSVVQYKSQIAYGTTIFTFLYCIVMNIQPLLYHIEQYLMEDNGAFWLLEYCPKCEIISILKLFGIYIFGIFLLNTKKMIEFYNWKIANSFKLVFIVYLIYLLNIIIPF